MGVWGFCIALQRYEKSERNANKNAFIFISERTSSSTNVLRLRLSTYGAQEGTTFLRHSQEMSRQISAYFLDLSGLIWTYLDKSGQWLRQLSYLCIVNPERHADGAGFTPRRRRKCRSAEQQKTDPDPLPRGVKAKKKLKTKPDPSLETVGHDCLNSRSEKK